MTTYQILVVEDQGIVALDIQNSLRKFGYSVPVIVSSGEEAIEKTAEIRPDLVLMDIKLKGDMDGVEAAGQIRARFGIPVVYLTAYADNNTLERAKKTEPHGYIIKPFEELELYTTIETALYKHKIERDLKESEEHFRSLIENALDIITVLSEDGTLRYQSPSIERVLGYKPEEMIGKNAFDFIHPDDLLHTRNAISRVVRNPGSSSSIELRFLHRNGSWCNLEAIVKTLPANSGERDVVVNSRDITERKQSEDFTKNILESIDEGIVVLDPDYRIISASQAYCKLVKKPLEEVLGRYCYEISHHIHKPCYETGEECAVKHTFQTGSPFTTIHTHRSKTGEPRYFEKKSHPMREPSGKIRSVIETIRDITEKRKLEDQLRHAQKMEAVGHLAGGISHDFNNILTAITGYGSLLLMKMDPDDPFRSYVEQILSSSERAANLTRSLLTFSRKQIINLKTVNLNGIVKRVEKLLLRVIGEDVELKTLS